jgi:hypothetical protein
MWTRTVTLAAVVVSVTSLSSFVAVPAKDAGIAHVQLDADGLSIAIAAGAGGVWVLSGNNDQTWVERINPRTRRVTAKIGVPFGSESLAAGEGAVWVWDVIGATLVRIDPARNRVVSRIRHLGVEADALVVGDHSIWAAGLNDRAPDPTTSSVVERIDPVTESVTARIPVSGDEVDAMAAGDGSVWVGTYIDPGMTDPFNFDAKAYSVMTRIDPATNTVRSTVESRKQRSDLADTPDAAMADGAQGLAIESGSLWRIDDTTRAWVRIPGLRFSCDCAMTPAEPGTLWVSDLGAARVLHISLATGTLDRSVRVEGPSGVAVGFGKVWVADQTTKSVVVLTE